MTTHTIPTTRNPTRQGHLMTEARILVAGSNNRAGWGLCAWTAEGAGRIVFQGPMVQGPYASLFGLCSVIDNHGGTGREMRDAEAAGQLFRVEPGDTIVLEGVRYTVSVCPRGYPELTGG